MVSLTLFTERLKERITSLLSISKSLISFAVFIQKTNMEIELVKEDPICCGKEEVRISLLNNKINLSLDPHGNISFLSTSSISIKSRLLFLVSNEDPNSLDSFIAKTIEIDKEGKEDSYLSFIDKEEISAL